MNLNKVFIIGRLTVDPQLKTTPGGQSVVTLGVATNRVWTGKTGGRQEETEYHNVVVWGKQAEVASQFLAKGSTVFIEGRLRTRSWKDKQGQNRKTTEIVCERMQLGPRSSGAGARGKAQETPAVSEASREKQEEIPVIDLEADGEIKPEDLPF
ncbi:single-stranded DNA-binding protein [Candidatus Parcubacteria bacterium]|nr:MAG: single-stranded DNA-binding protein [Candidatus Parcubacteria bacterium]